MKLTIHRGSREVGGNCLEVASENGTRLILDVGLPLFDDQRRPLDSSSFFRLQKAELLEQVKLPSVPGLFEGEPLPNAILLSHAHQDHTGLLGFTNPSIPVYASRGTSKMMLAGSLFARQVELPRERYREIQPDVTIQIGDIQVTAFPVDHSIYGAVAYLIEADGKRLLYSGDLRTHGRKPGMQQGLIETLQNRPLDVLVMEGTHFGFPDGNPANEYELEASITDLVQECSSLVLASFSPQHLDRLVAMIRAAKETGRIFVADVYTAFILHLLQNEVPLPQPEQGGLVQVYVPQNLKNAQQKSGRGQQIERFRHAEISLAEIQDNPERFLMVFRASMREDFGNVFPPETCCLYSRWNGYLDQPESKITQQILANAHGHLHDVHTSGHMLSKDIVRFVNQLNPQTIIPVHTFEPQMFGDHFDNVRILADSQSVEI